MYEVLLFLCSPKLSLVISFTYDSAPADRLGHGHCPGIARRRLWDRATPRFGRPFALARQVAVYKVAANLDIVVPEIWVCMTSYTIQDIGCKESRHPCSSRLLAAVTLGRCSSQWAITWISAWIFAILKIFSGASVAISQSLARRMIARDPGGRSSGRITNDITSDSFKTT